MNLFISDGSSQAMFVTSSSLCLLVLPLIWKPWGALSFKIGGDWHPCWWHWTVPHLQSKHCKHGFTRFLACFWHVHQHTLICIGMHWFILVHCLDSGFAPTLKNTVSSTKFTGEIRRWLPQTPQVSVGPRSLRRFCVTWATRRCVFFSACFCTVSAAKLFMFITSCKLDSRFAV